MTGTLIRKTAPHQKSSSTAPPTSGPSAAPEEKLVIHSPIAVARCWGSGNMVRINDSVDGANVAPDSPSIARLTISVSGVVEKAARTEVAPNTAAPISSRRRRPMRSPRLPIVRRAPATMKP